MWQVQVARYNARRLGGQLRSDVVKTMVHDVGLDV
jgi:hypothetical protein